MDWANLVLLLIAAITAGSAYASQRSANKAATINTQTTGRLDAEKDAYNRARAFDTDTIERQDKELAELRADNRDLHEKVAVAQSESRAARAEAREAHAENAALRERIAVLEGRAHEPDHTG